MDIMNLIHDICLTTNAINNTPRWKIITKNKYEKRLIIDRTDFLNLDIFSASDNIITFLLGLGKDITTNIDGFLKYNESYIMIQILDNELIFTNVTYFPLSNRFVIENDHVIYTIYRNSKISNHIHNIWEPLTHKIKERYLDIIIQMADYLST